jgi:hypothetical protein
LAFSLTVDTASNLTLNKDSPTFVKPEMFLKFTNGKYSIQELLDNMPEWAKRTYPAFSSDKVTHPAMSDFMGNDINSALVTSKESRSDKCEARILHTTIWERRRKDK